MADQKISQLPILSSVPSSGIFLPILDNNEANDADKNKRIDFNSIGGGGGMSGAEKSLLLQTYSQLQETRYRQGLEQLGFKGGFYDVFANKDKIKNSGESGANTYSISSITSGGRIEENSLSSSRNWLAGMINEDGTRLIVAGRNTSTGELAIESHTLTTPFDVSTNTSPTVVTVPSSSVALNVNDVAFADNGTRIFVYKLTIDTIYSAEMSTPYDINTIGAWSSQVLSGVPDYQHICLSRDGLKFYAMYNFISSSWRIDTYDFGTAWDISTLTINSGQQGSFSMSNPAGFDINPSGTQFIFADDGANDFKPFDMSTPYDPSSGSLQTGVSGGRSVGGGLSWSNGGRLLLAFTNAAVYEWDMGIAFGAVKDITQLDVSTIEKNNTALVKLKGGQYNVATATQTNSFDISAEISQPYDAQYNNDGTKVYVRSGSNGIDTYNLSAPYDISTLDTLSKVQTSLTQSSTIDSFWISSDGAKLYTVSSSNIDEYDLTTAWDISTFSHVADFSVSPQTSSPFGIAFTDDLSAFYVAWESTGVLYLYANDGANISNARFIKSYNIPGTSSYKGIFLAPDGSKMFTLHSSSEIIYTLELDNPNSLESYTLTQRDISPPTSNIHSIKFSQDGLKFLVTSDGDDTIYQYDCSEDFMTSGNYKSVTFDLSNDLASNPKEVVVSSECVVPANTSVNIAISDGTNTVNVGDASFDTVVDCSSLTSRVLSITVTISTTNVAASPELVNLALYFTD